LGCYPMGRWCISLRVPAFGVGILLKCKYLYSLFLLLLQSPHWPLMWRSVPHSNPRLDVKPSSFLRNRSCCCFWVLMLSFSSKNVLLHRISICLGYSWTDVYPSLERLTLIIGQFWKMKTTSRSLPMCWYHESWPCKSYNLANWKDIGILFRFLM
jgi:hypothetical protein